MKILRKIFKSIMALIRKVARKISPKLGNWLDYFFLYKRPINTRNPRTFGEKMMVRMSSEGFRQLADYADKWKVREYVSDTIGEEYHIPLLAVYDTPQEVDYGQIPTGAYIKLNHGCGMNLVYEPEKQEQIHKAVTKWYYSDFSKRKCEQQYKPIQPKVLVEKNVHREGEPFWEYNFYTFDGKTELVQVRNDRQERFEVGREYEQLPYRMFSTVTPVREKVPEFERMVELTEQLAAPFTFVRVDFFLVGRQIYFAELTFSPGAGRKMFKPFEYNLIFGDKLSTTELFRQ